MAYYCYTKTAPIDRTIFDGRCSAGLGRRSWNCWKTARMQHLTQGVGFHRWTMKNPWDLKGAPFFGTPFVRVSEDLETYSESSSVTLYQGHWIRSYFTSALPIYPICKWFVGHRHTWFLGLWVNSQKQGKQKSAASIGSLAYRNHLANIRSKRTHVQLSTLMGSSFTPDMSDGRILVLLQTDLCMSLFGFETASLRRHAWIVISPPAHARIPQIKS